MPMVLLNIYSTINTCVAYAYPTESSSPLISLIGENIRAVPSLVCNFQLPIQAPTSSLTNSSLLICRVAGVVGFFGQRVLRSLGCVKAARVSSPTGKGPSKLGLACLHGSPLRGGIHL